MPRPPMARGELQLIDVREPSELSEARVKGARHIPLGQLSAKLGELDRLNNGPRTPWCAARRERIGPN